MNVVNANSGESYRLACSCIDYVLAVELSMCPRDLKVLRHPFVERVAFELVATHKLDLGISLIYERLDALRADQSKPALFSQYEHGFFVLHRDAAPVIPTELPELLTYGGRPPCRTMFESVKEKSE